MKALKETLMKHIFEDVTKCYELLETDQQVHQNHLIIVACSGYMLEEEMNEFFPEFISDTCTK